MSKHSDVSHITRYLKDAVFAFSAEGRLQYCNRELLCQDSLDTGHDRVITWNEVFDAESVTSLIEILRQGEPHTRGRQVFLTLLMEEVQSIKVEAEVSLQRSGGSQNTLFIHLVSVVDDRPADFSCEEDFDVLSDIIDTFSIPTWCIEFQEPVDITLSDRETMRQIFQNDSYWRMCNKAFARLYGLPDDLDFNKQPVRYFFPRSPENEKFIHQVIENDFTVDNALSMDANHDGSALYIENSVRAHIEDGRLLRLWGTARDITSEKRTVNRLIHRETEIRGVLSSIPDVVLVVNRLGILQGANPAFENQFGWCVDDWLGRDVNEIVKLRDYLRGRSRLKIDQQMRFIGQVTLPNQSVRNFDVSLSCSLDDMDEERFVAVFRPVTGPDE